MTTKVYKQLAAMEDLTYGQQGRVTQSRNGTSIEVDPINFDYTFDTVEDMVTSGLALLVEGAVVNTKGYYTKGGGGAANYTVTTDIPDGFGKLDLGNGLTASINIKNALDVLQIGAKNEVGFNSAPQIQLYIDRAYAEQFSLYSRGYIEIDEPLVFEAPSGVVYWDNTSDLRPPMFIFDSIKCNSEDKAIDAIGAVVGAKIIINSLIGPGVTTIQPEGSNIERIGLRCSHNQNSVTVNSISDFNINVLLDGAFNTKINLGSCFAAIYGVHSRVGSINGSNNQNNQVNYGFIGGPFTSDSFPDTILRRSRGCKYGIYMLQGTAFKFTGGALKYIQRDSNSIAIKLSKDAHNNKFFCYLEGASEEGYYLDCAGDNNEFFLDELRSTTVAKDSIIITGIGNTIEMLPGRVSETAKLARSSEATAGTVTITPGNTLNGKNSIIESKVASILKHNLLSGISLALGGDGSKTVVSDFPQESDGADSIEITCNSSGLVWVDWSGIDLDVETLRTLQIHTWLKGHTNHAKVAFYIVDNSDKTIVLNDPISTGLNSASDWQKLTTKTIIDTPPSGLITLRMAVRNTIDSETGCKILVYPPVLTFNIDTSNRNLSDDILPNTDVVEGKVIPEELLHLRTDAYLVQIVEDLPSNTLVTNGRGIVNITGNASAGNIAAINGMRENTSVTIVNSHISTITVLASAGEWNTDFLLNPGESIIIVDVGGLKYLNRS